MVAGFAAGLDMAGFCVTGTSAPAASPGPNGGIEITCTRATAIHQGLLWPVLMCMMHRTSCVLPSVGNKGMISISKLLLSALNTCWGCTETYEVPINTNPRLLACQ